MTSHNCSGYPLKTGEKESMHWHLAGVVYVLNSAKLKFTYPGLPK